MSGRIANQAKLFPSKDKSPQRSLNARRALHVGAVTAAIATVVAQPALAGLTHRYSFSEIGGNTVTDSVGTSNGVLVDRSANGAVAPTLGGGSVTFNNSGTSADVTLGNYVDLPNNIAKTTNVTIESWATWGGGNDWQRIFDIGNNTAPANATTGDPAGEQSPASTLGGYNGSSYLFASPKVGRNGNVFGSELRIDPAGTNADQVGGGNFGIATEHHFALSIKGGAGGNMTLFKDGVSVASSATTLDPAAINQLNTWIGRSNWSGDPFFNGSVNEFRIYDTAQTALQIAASFSAGPNALPSGSVTNKWINPGASDYNNAANWNTGNVPANGDIALFDNGGEGVIAVDTTNLVALQLKKGSVTVNSTFNYTPASTDFQPASVAGQFATLNLSGTITSTYTIDGAATTTGTSPTSINFVGGTLKGGGSIVGPNVTINLGAGGGTIDTNGSNLTIQAAITGGDGLVKAGAGTLTYIYPASNTTDLTTGRTLDITNGTLAIDTNGQSVTFANSIGGTGGTLTKQGSGTLTLKGASNGNNVFVTKGSLVLDGASAIATTANFSSFGVNNGDNGRMVVQNGAQLTVKGDFNVSDLGGSIGTLVIAGAGSKVTPYTVYIGKNGNAQGVVNQSGGTFVRDATNGGDWRIGGPFNATNDAASVGTYDLSGGTFDAGASNLQIGAFARGAMTISGTGIALSNSFPVVGRFAGAFGVLTINGGSFTQSATGSFMIIGEQGTGVVNVAGTGTLNVGNADINTGLRLGNQKSGAGDAATGFANLGTGGTINATAVTRNAAVGNNVGGNTIAYLNFHGGKLASKVANPNFLQNLTGAYVWSEGGIVDTTNGDVTISQNLLAPTGSGVVTIPVTTGGTGYQGTPIVQVTGGTTGLGATAIANLTAGVVTSVTVTNPGVDYTGAVTIALFGGNPTTPATLGTATLGANTSGGLTKTGTGTLTIAGAGNTYVGTSTVSAGTLLVTGALAGGALVNTAGATLGGSGGTLAGPITLTAGSLAPGNSGPGKLTSGGVAFGGTGTAYKVEIGGVTAGTLYDQLAISAGTVALSNATLNVSLLAFVPGASDTFRIIDKQSSGAVSGTFNGLADGGTLTSGGTTFKINYAGGDGNDVVLSVVPEPTSLSLLGLGAIGLLARRRRRRLQVERV